MSAFIHRFCVSIGAWYSVPWPCSAGSLPPTASTAYGTCWNWPWLEHGYMASFHQTEATENAKKCSNHADITNNNPGIYDQCWWVFVMFYILFLRILGVWMGLRHIFRLQVDGATISNLHQGLEFRQDYHVKTWLYNTYYNITIYYNDSPGLFWLGVAGSTILLA